MAALLLATLLAGLAPAAQAASARGRFVVANRGSGSISVIDAKSWQLIDTVMLPPGDAQPEPMYVVYTAAVSRVWVGDRHALSHPPQHRPHPRIAEPSL
jgi:hypothetical protein